MRGDPVGGFYDIEELFRGLKNTDQKLCEEMEDRFNEIPDKIQPEMNKPKYESQRLVSIANNRAFIEKDILAIEAPDGFVNLSLSIHLASDIPIPNEIGDKYLYNKNGEVISVNTGQRLKLHHNEFKASHEGVVYEVYMPKNSILASRVEPVGENDDIIFRSIKEACEHFKCNYRTIKACLDKSGEKAFLNMGGRSLMLLGLKNAPLRNCMSANLQKDLMMLMLTSVVFSCV